MLILVRHGQSEANAAGVLVGRTDSPLTDLGKRQARCIGAALKAASVGSGQPAPRVVCSPLQRAFETATIVAGELGLAEALEIDGRLIELDYGDLEGKRPSELAGGEWAAWRADTSWRPPGGETLPELHTRLDPFWESVVSEAAKADVIAVTHVSPIKAAVAWVLGTGPEVAWKLSLGVASITRISTAGPFPAVVSFGETAHLARAAELSA